MNSHEKKSILYYLGLGELRSVNDSEKYLFLLILYLSFSLFASQNYLAPNLRYIASSFNIASQSGIDFYIGGMISLLSFSAGSIASIIVSFFIKNYSGNFLILIISSVGEMFCIFAGLSNSYLLFAFCSAAAGAMTGAFFPLYFSSVGSVFSEKSRLTAIAYASAVMGLGIGAGQILGGILADRYGENGWRICFLILSVPGVFLITLYFLVFGKQMPRFLKSNESLREGSRFSLILLKRNFSNRSNIGILLQGIPGCIPWGYLVCL